MYLLQLFNISCFAVSKYLYRNLVDQKIQFGISYIDKFNFFTVYPEIRINTFQIFIIKNRFVAADLILFDTEQIFSKFNIRFQISISSENRPNSRSSIFIPKISTTVAELLKQIFSIKVFLKQYSNSSPLLLQTALNQFIKDCQFAIQNSILLEQENRELYTANTVQKQKCIRINRYIVLKLVSQYRKLRRIYKPIRLVYSL